MISAHIHPQHCRCGACTGVRKMDLVRLQRQFDEEGRTIEAGRRSFHPERPPGQPSMFAGVCYTLLGFLVLACLAAVLP